MANSNLIKSHGLPALDNTHGGPRAGHSEPQPELYARRARGRLAQQRFRQRQIDTIKQLEARVVELETGIQQIRGAAEKLGMVLDVSASLDDPSQMLHMMHKAVARLNSTIEAAAREGEEQRRPREDSTSPDSLPSDEGCVGERYQGVDGVMRTLLSMPCAESQGSRTNGSMDSRDPDIDSDWTLAPKNKSPSPQIDRAVLAEKVHQESRPVPSTAGACLNIFASTSWAQILGQAL